jgi:hypothetical protein
MDTRKAVYLEEYVAAHNECLRAHPRYREDMGFSLGSGRGDLVQRTKDRQISEDDAGVFDEIRRQVATTHTLVLA